MKFEILLDNEPHRRDQARKQIEAVAGTLSENFIPDEEYPAFGNLVEVNAAVAGEAIWQLHDELMAVDGVVDVDPDMEMEAKEDELNAQYYAESVLHSSAQAVHPPANWYHKFVRFPEAVQWARSAATAGMGQFRNQRIKVAQLDTGYTNHPEVRNFKVSEGRNFLLTEDPKKPYDRLRSTRPVPVLWGGHGTSCAGVMIGAFAEITEREPSPDDQLYYEDLADGLFSDIDLIPYRISRNIISFSNKMAKGLHHVIGKKDIPVVSVSHATLLPKRALWLAVKEAADQGIIVVAAPGSHVKGFRKIFTYPAKYDETIAVAASKCNGDPWEKTHGGPEVDLCAPGYDIYIPFPYRKKGKEYYAYKYSEGSSFSVPITACAAALWLCHHGVDKLKSRYPGRQLVELFRNTCRQTVTPFSGPADTGLYGCGILNVKNLLSAPLPASPTLMAGARSGPAGTRAAIDNLQQTIAHDQHRYLIEKELTYQTLLAKLDTEDLGNELAEYVMDHASPAVKNYIGPAFRSEEIKTKVKSFTETYYSGR